MAKKRKVTRRRRARVSGLNSKDMGGIATNALIGGVGAFALKMVAEKVLPAEYAQYSNYIITAGGIAIAATVKNPMVQAAGLGAATVGAANIVSDLADGQSINLLPPGGRSQYQLAGLDGKPGFGDKITVL